MSALVVYNPVCGDSTAHAFFQDHVLPLLHEHSIATPQIILTERPGHAGTAVVDYLTSRADPQAELTIILGSGDGTLHEIINAISVFPTKGYFVSFVLIPCGTANALYSSLFSPVQGDTTPAYRLQSLHKYLGKSPSNPLTLARTTLVSPESDDHPTIAISAVVASTALHASILLDSESLRQEMPGIERFKVAAMNNSTRWYNSSIKLLPVPSVGKVEIYDPRSDAFTSFQSENEHGSEIELDGPSIYFLSTVNVDRLEPFFCIAPLMSRDTLKQESMHVVIIRPQRDPSFKPDSHEMRVAFAKKVSAVLTAAYNNGNHIKLRYGEDGRVTDEGSGPTVVEYIRCGGWEWIPNKDDERAHLVCSDGDILEIKKGGKASCRLALQGHNDNTECKVYA